MKILVATVPAAGHFNPLTGPAVRLAERGHDVRWYAGPEYATRVERLGLAVIPYAEASEITADNVNAVFPERQNLKGPKAIEFDADVFFARPVGAQFHDIRDARERFPFDALLIDGAFYAGYLAAKLLDVPVFVMGSIAAPTLRGSNPITPFFGLRPARTFAGRIVNRIARAMLLSASRKAVGTFNRFLAEEGLPAVTAEDYLDCTQQPDVARRVFNVGLPELDFPGAYVPPNTEWVGALLPHRPKAPASLDPRILERSGQVVVVSQGTVDNHDPRKLMIPAIEAFAGRDRLLVVVTGGVGTDELRSRYPRDNVLIEDFVDFDVLFPHAELYVTNGGLGGVLLALSHGVPLLVAGTREGKGDINVRLAYRGLAVDLRSETPSAGAVARGAERVLRDKEMKARIAAVRTALAEYDSVGIIERGLLDSLRSRGAYEMETGQIDVDVRAARPRARAAALSILTGALLGVTWAAGFRAFMAEIAGPDSTFGWYATFGAVLGGAGIVGGLLGWADHIRRTGGRPHWRWLALSPLILGLLPLTVPGTLAALAQGIGTAGMAVALIAIGLGYAFGGRGRAWLRAVVGAISTGAAVALVAFTPLISEGRISFSDPRGAWAGTLALGSIIVLGLATSIPFRPVLPQIRSADAPPPVLKDRTPKPV